MDKEEEKKIKERLRSLSTGLVYEKEKVREHYIFTTKHELDDSNKSLKEYIEYLEQKEFILDKVTDKLSKMKQSIEKLKNRDGESMLMVDVCIQNIIAFYDDIEKIF